MASLLTEAKAIFWSEWFWFPGNVTWSDLENKEGGIYHPQVSDLLIPFPLAVLIYVIRQCVERYIFRPMGIYYGLKDSKARVATSNTVLEKAYKKAGKKDPSKDVVMGLIKQVDMTEKQIGNWFRMRRNQDRPTTLVKFTESGWRFVMYFCLFNYGLLVLFDKDYFWNGDYCWLGYPHQHVSDGVFWYYMLELGCYWSLLFSQFLDVQRKDFYEMFIHHIATLTLMLFSWSGNFVRIGSLVLVVHDAADWWMESAKMAKYLNFSFLCNVLFGMFLVVWFVSRLVIFPYKIIRPTHFSVQRILGTLVSVQYFLNILLIVLFILHIYWFVLILRVAKMAMMSRGKVRPVTFEIYKFEN
ncbi:hypothetical protein ScPMuIL_016348 [Solemya velum]